MRLGKYPCRLAENSAVRRIFAQELIDERHRHRYEVNNEYRVLYENAGIRLSGISPDGRIVEMIELPEHPGILPANSTGI